MKQPSNDSRYKFNGRQSLPIMNSMTCLLSSIDRNVLINNANFFDFVDFSTDTQKQIRSVHDLQSIK
jgi:hypothetical protein